MAKNVVFCADGTWNSPNETDNGVIAPTNVSKLYALLVNDATQVTYYDDGIGADEIGLEKVFAGITGNGLTQKIIDGYQFIMDNYIPGDAIYLFGFSRGAYTVRYLAAIMARLGLLMPTPNETLDEKRQRINDVYQAYKNRTTPPEHLMHTNFTIRMIGVFDTVGALGIPLETLASTNHDLYCFHDTVLDKKVLFAYQALAIDEKRVLFVPTLWQNRDGIEQVWFVGAHSDVGGGYAQAGLSDIALNWMYYRAISRGLLINKQPIPNGDPFGIIHTPWNSFPFTITDVAPRTIPDHSNIHDSVITRTDNQALNYNPLNLPADINIVKT